MGKGDKKTKRGKITIGTYGVRRRPFKNKKTLLNDPEKTTPKMEKAPEPTAVKRKPIRTNTTR